MTTATVIIGNDHSVWDGGLRQTHTIDLNENGSRPTLVLRDREGKVVEALAASLESYSIVRDIFDLIRKHIPIPTPAEPAGNGHDYIQIHIVILSRTSLLKDIHPRLLAKEYRNTKIYKQCG